MRHRSGRAALAALLFTLAGTAVACGSDDDTSSSTSTTAPTTTTTNVPTMTAVVWPAPDASPSATREDAALGFAREFLGMSEASLADPSSDGTVVAVRPFEASGPTTLVQVTERDDGWGVTGASSDMIVVASPEPGAAITDPLSVRGEASAFEGTIQLELRPPGALEPVATTFTTAGANGEMGPFETTIEAPTEDPAVLVVYAPDASGRGRMLAATVLALG